MADLEHRHRNDPAVRAEAEMRRLLRAQRQDSSDTGSSMLDGPDACPPDEIVRVLRPYLSDERAEKIEAVLEGRTVTVVPVVEGLLDTGNVSAVMRTAEALGYLRMDIVVGDTAFTRSERTTRGADKWLDVRTWPAPQVCVASLREQGYRIVATHVDAAVDIAEIDFTRKTVLVFGNEAEGLSGEMLRLADERCYVPTSGFVQSLNISVAAAICLHQARRDRMARQGFHGDLSEMEREQCRAMYYFRSVGAAESILAHARRET